MKYDSKKRPFWAKSGFHEGFRRKLRKNRGKKSKNEAFLKKKEAFLGKKWISRRV